MDPVGGHRGDLLADDNVDEGGEVPLIGGSHGSEAIPIGLGNEGTQMRAALLEELHASVDVIGRAAQTGVRHQLSIHQPSIHQLAQRG